MKLPLRPSLPIVLLAAIVLVLLVPTCKPFAPALDQVPTDQNQPLGNPVHMRGFFD